MNRLFRTVIISSLMFAAPLAAHAEEFTLTLKDHVFAPKELTIPKDQKVKIIVKNLDATPAEFESHDLKREKVIPGKGQIVLSVGPLTEGKYSFFDEYNEDTAKGTIIVK